MAVNYACVHLLPDQRSLDNRDSKSFGWAKNVNRRVLRLSLKYNIKSVLCVHKD
jgi:hypothetical protein